VDPIAEDYLRRGARDIAGSEATICMPIIVANAAPQLVSALLIGLAVGG